MTKPADSTIKTFLDKNPKIKESIIAAKKALEDFKTMFAGEAPKMTEGKLKDGTTIKYSGDTLGVGSIVILVNKDGEMPAPEGELILEDGTILMIKKEGDNSVVSEITAPKDAETEMKAKKESLKVLMTKFAAGTPEERIANLEIVGKALMEYTFGWELQKPNKEAALSIYTTLMAEKKVIDSTEIAKAHNFLNVENKALKLKIDSLELKLGKQAKIAEDTLALVIEFGNIPTDDQAEGGEHKTKFKKATNEEVEKMSPLEQRRYKKALEAQA